MKRLLLITFCIITLVFTLGCNKTEKSTVSKTIDSDKAGYTVTDSTGSVLHFAKKPERIMSLSSSVDEILLNLVDSKRIIALTYLVDDPAVSAVHDKAKEVKGRAKMGDIEGIVGMHPDLILIPDWVDTTPVQTLKDLGINVYVYKTPGTLEEIKESINLLAKLTGDEEQGAKIVEEMNKKEKAVWDKVSTLPKDKVRTIVAFSQMGTVGAKGTTFDDICKHANVSNLVARTDITKYDTLSKEQVVTLDPDVFLMPTWDEMGKGELKEFIAEVKNDPAYSTIKAVKNNRMVSISDKYMYSFSQYAVYAVEELAQKVYPELYEK